MDFATHQSVLGVAQGRVLAFLLEVQVCVPRIGSAHNIRSREQLEFAACSELILQRSGIVARQRHRALAGFEVQEFVAQGQVEQLALPSLKTVE